MADSDLSQSIASLGGNEAEDYVESVMGSQQIERVETPVTNVRKRQLSTPGSTRDEGSDTVCNYKLHDGTLLSEPRKEVKKARRTLVTEPSSPSQGGRLVVTGADVHVSAETSIEQLINKLSTDVRSMFTDLSSRLDRLESGLEQRISKKVSQLLDKRVNTEMSRIKKDVDAQIISVKEEVAADISDLNEKLDSLKLGTPSPQPDISRNIIIRNLPETSSERIESKVNSLFRDGLKLGNIAASSAERKGTQECSNKPGVVIVTLKSTEDKKKVMSAKNKLKNHRQYSKVYINHDQSRSERLLADNFRAILAAVKNGDTNLAIRGARVVRTSSSDGDSRDNIGSPPPPASRDSRRPTDSNSRSRDRDSRRDRSRGPTGRENFGGRDNRAGRDNYGGRDNRRPHQGRSRNDRR